MNEMRRLLNIMESSMTNNVMQIGTSMNLLDTVREELLKNIMSNFEEIFVYVGGMDQSKFSKIANEISTTVGSTSTDTDGHDVAEKIYNIAEQHLGSAEDAAETMNEYAIADQIDKLAYVNTMIENKEKSPESAVASQKYGYLDTMMRDDLIAEINSVAQRFFNRHEKEISTQNPDSWTPEDRDRWNQELDDYMKREPFMARSMIKQFGKIADIGKDRGDFS